MIRKKRILIVDDDETLLFSLKIWLESKKEFQVFVASNADDALTIADQEWLHLMVIDLRLDPNNDDDRSGFDLARKMWGGTPKIFLTTVSDLPSAVRAGFYEMRESNVVGYVAKKDGEQEAPSSHSQNPGSA